MLAHLAHRVDSVTPGNHNPAPATRPVIKADSLVSVGIPTYNRAAALSEAIASCLAQTYANIEIIVSDNASTDGTPGLCAQWQRDEPRIKVIRQPRNIGRERNFGAVLEEASGELFIWLSDDDTLDPRCVEACVAGFVAHQDYAIVGGHVEYVKPDGVRFQEPAVRLDAVDPERRVVAYLSTVGLNGTYYGLMRTSDVLSVEYPITFGGDWYFVAQMAALGRIASLPEVTVYRDVTGESSDLAELAASFGMRRHWERDLHLWALLLFVPALLSGRGSFGTMSLGQRRWASLRIVVALVRRWWLRNGRGRGLPVRLAGAFRHNLPAERR